MFACGELGMPEDEFWRRTPYDMHLRRIGWQRRMRREMARDRGLAWMTAYLQRAKRIPSYKRWVTPQRDKMGRRELERARRQHEDIAGRLG